MVWEPMVRKYLGEARATKKHVKQISQALVQTIFHVLLVWSAWRILLPKAWIWRNDEWNQQEEPTVAPDVKFFYLLFVARFLSETLSCRNDYTQRDMWAYAVQHVASIALVLGLAMAGYIRIGCILMLCLDWQDPFTLMAKMFLALSADTGHGYQFVAALLMKEVFGILFLIARTVLLNYVAWICLRDFPELAVVLKALCIVLVLLQTLWVVRYFFNRESLDDFGASDYNDNVHEEHKSISRRKKGKKKKH